VEVRFSRSRLLNLEEREEDHSPVRALRGEKKDGTHAEKQNLGNRKEPILG